MSYQSLLVTCRLNAPAAESLSIAEGESTPEFVENRQVLVVGDDFGFVDLLCVTV